MGPSHADIHEHRYRMSMAKGRHLTQCRNWPFVIPCRNGLPEACRPCGLATARPGTAHPAEAVSRPVHGAVPGADRPVHPLHSGAVYEVQKDRREDVNCCYTLGCEPRMPRSSSHLPGRGAGWLLTLLCRASQRTAPGSERFRWFRRGQASSLYNCLWEASHYSMEFSDL